MRIDARLKINRDDVNVRTTRCEPLDESPPAKDFRINTELLSSPPLNAEDVLVLSLASEPYADGEVAVKLPPIPFFEEFTQVVRYQHTGERHPRSRRKPRPARNTPELGITLCYLKKEILGREFVSAQGPLYLGLSPATKAVTEGRMQPLIEDVVAADEAVRAAALAALDDLIRARVRPQRGARLTSRQIWDVWAAQWGANPTDDIIAGITLPDISRRFRAVFEATTATNPTRIDGRLQRYWDGYTI